MNYVATRRGEPYIEPDLDSHLLWDQDDEENKRIALAWQQWQSPTWPLPPRERGYGEARHLWVPGVWESREQGYPTEVEAK